MSQTHQELAISELPVFAGIHGPQELSQEILGEHLFDLDLILLAPGDTDSRIVVVGLTCSQSDLKVFFSCLEVL